MNKFKKAWMALCAFAVALCGSTAYAYTNQMEQLETAASDISGFFGTVWGVVISIVVAFILLGILNKVRTRR